MNPLLKHPQIFALYEIYQSENQPFRKVHRMIDLFESIIKTHTVVILSEYVSHNQLSDTAKGLLSQGLRTPSLGTWQLFSRVLFEELQAQNYPWNFSDFPAEFAALDKALNADKTNVISFRNGYAHGATPTDEQCQADVQKFEPFLEKLLQSQWLLNSHLEERDGKVWITSNKSALCAHPVLVYKPEGNHPPFAFFNDLKNDRVGLLNYPLSKHYREKDFWNEFHEYLPLHEWKKTGSSDFAQRIEELTETFKGRVVERAQIHDFVFSKNKGYFSIQGNPGIGKSALIAQVFKEIKGHKEAKNIHCIEYFIRRGTQQSDIDYLLNYLIKRTDEVFPQGREIRAEGKMTFDLQNQLFSKWRQWAEHSQGKKLLFLIDGLDEGVENKVLTYMPRENFENILIIYGSRPGGHKTIDELWATLPPEHHTALLLEGLSKADIRALIYEVANKYEVERESAWIDAVQERSQGNPLYLRLLCNAIENGSIALNDVNALPKEIDEYYKAILSRYAQDMVDGDALLNGLFAFAAAKDYLTMAHLGLINHLGDATVQRIGSTLKEVLYENPLTEDVLDYQLFHESFREYLVKEKAKPVNDAAERILDFCAGWQELQGTWEQRYTLEHYALHLSESTKEKRDEELRNLLMNSRYTATQQKVLKQFDASRDLARIGLLKATEWKDFDVQLECALQLVDLKYDEANDAHQVVALVANGEIDLALKRIESFGGADKEGVKRRFILYMLCLMELTLLDSKTKPFRKAGIEKLLNHLDEQLPTDHSILKWNDFFPSYLMFQMAFEWAELGLDYLIVFKRTDNWENDWLSERGAFSSLKIEVLLECARWISSYRLKISALRDISSELGKQGQVEEALACARGISDKSDKISALAKISTELGKQGQVEEAATAMQEALACALGIRYESDKSSALCDISSELAKQGQVEEAASAMQEALACARGIRYDWGKSSALAKISTELGKQGQLEEALACSRGISSDREKSSALKDISTELGKQGQVEEALACARGISDDSDKSSALKAISTELWNQGQVKEAASAMQEALACARGISSESGKSSALANISTELGKQGQVEEAAMAMQEALACARGIRSGYMKLSVLHEIIIELAKQGQLEEALACARGIRYTSNKISALRDISSELGKQGLVEKAASVMQEILISVRGISNESKKSSVLKDISILLAKQGQVEVALACPHGISDDYSKISVLCDISSELGKQGQAEEAASAMREALACARGISYDWEKSSALANISTELGKLGMVEEAASAMQEALACARGISSESGKSSALAKISTELGKLGRVEGAEMAMQEALACARGIRFEWKKSSALAKIIRELAKQGQLEEALACARGISDDYRKISALREISNELGKQGLVEEAASAMQEALACARGTRVDFYKSSALANISTELVIQGQLEEAASAMQEALACARGISDESVKCSSLKNISTELGKQGQVEEAESVGLEIPQIAQRHECWKEMAKLSLEKDAWNVALNGVITYKSDEARLFYLKGWCEHVAVENVTASCVAEAFPYIASDSESIESLLQKYALQETLLGKPGTTLQERLNRTLNIQWAMDIAAQFPQEESNTRLSTNLETWLHEIADEDDRDQIELWAKQVSKGKISEEDFGEKVRGILN